MKKILVNPEILDDPWFQDAPLKFRYFWLYLLLKCDSVGVWRPNFKAVKFFVDDDIEEKDALKFLGDRILILDDGKWWIRKYCEYQYGSLISPASIKKSLQNQKRITNYALSYIRALKSGHYQKKDLYEILYCPLDHDLLEYYLGEIIRIKTHGNDEHLSIDFARLFPSAKENKPPDSAHTTKNHLERESTLFVLKGGASGTKTVEAQETEMRPIFNDFWNAYDKKVGPKDTIKKKWEAIPIKKRMGIMDHVRAYVKSTPEKQYRKDPLTYLKQKAYEDEIIEPSNEKGRADNNANNFSKEEHRKVVP